MRRDNPSLFGRLIWLNVLATATVIGLIALVINILIKSTTETYEHGLLSERARLIAGALSRRSGAWGLNLPAREALQFAPERNGYGYDVVTRSMRLLFSSGSNAHVFVPEAARGISTRFSLVRHGGSLFDVGVFPQRRSDNDLVIVIYQDLNAPDAVIDDMARSFQTSILLIIPITFAALFASIALVVRYTLRPLLRASLLAETINPNKLDVRLPTLHQPKEILPLLRAVNSAFDRIAVSYTAKKQFTADAAHELRTPLAVLRLRIEELCELTTAKILLRDLDVMSTLVSKLLALDELDTRSALIDSHFDLNEGAERVAMHFAPIAYQDGKAIELYTTGSPLMVWGDGDLIFLALRNLVENAVAHTPAGTSVEISVASDASVSVKDRGPGIQRHERQLVLERFWRRDKQRDNSSGLGLAIVSRIVDIHGGELRIESRSAGGACVILCLRPA